MDKGIRNWLVTPSLFYLMVVLISGILIRIQWIQPEWQLFNSRYLIHSHSHLAMLGWLFPAIAAFLLHSGVNKSSIRLIIHPFYLLCLHFFLVAMTISFALEGYAFNSILLSSLFVILMLWFGYVFLTHISIDLPIMFRYYSIAAVWLMILSNIGPYALSAGVFMGQSWVNSWISYYLHFQFSGWITLALIALLYLNISIPAEKLNQSVTGFILLLLGFPLTLVPLLDVITMNLAWYLAAISGGIFTLSGSVIVYKDVINFSSDENATSGKLLLYSALIALLFKALFQLFSGIPEFGQQLIKTHFLSIGFSHLILLGFATPLLILFINRNFAITGRTAFIGIAALLSGSILMIFLLFLFGILQFLLIPVFIPIQLILTICGIVALSGTALWLLKFLMSYES